MATFRNKQLLALVSAGGCLAVLATCRSRDVATSLREPPQPVLRDADSDAGVEDAAAAEFQLPTGILTANKLQGPYAHFPADVCKDLGGERDRCDPKLTWSDQGAGPQRVASSEDPILEARLFRVQRYLSGQNIKWEELGLALRTRRGWFAVLYNPWGTSLPMGAGKVVADVQAFRLERAGGERVLLLDYTQTNSLTTLDSARDGVNHIEGVVQFDRQYLVLCSVGGSGVPSCILAATGCTGPGQAWVEVELRISRAARELTATWSKDEIPSCTWGTGLTFGKFELEFP